MGAREALREFLAQTVPVPGLRADERAVQGLGGMAPEEWVMITLRVHSEETLQLAELFVPSDYRGRGFGTLALRHVQALATRHHCRLESFVRPFGFRPALNRRALTAWYRRHGFVVSRDGAMHWPPRRAKEPR